MDTIETAHPAAAAAALPPPIADEITAEEALRLELYEAKMANVMLLSDALKREAALIEAEYQTFTAEVGARYGLKIGADGIDLKTRKIKRA